ncbi:MAG TPA: hypothetical protein VLA04_01880 [Verrucomicrobiae bacterium]|nr:hypothetical protein [Verrucomicrobiae bacterium]
MKIAVSLLLAVFATTTVVAQTTTAPEAQPAQQAASWSAASFPPDICRGGFRSTKWWNEAPAEFNHGDVRFRALTLEVAMELSVKEGDTVMVIMRPLKGKAGDFRLTPTKVVGVSIQDAGVVDVRVLRVTPLDPKGFQPGWVTTGGGEKLELRVIPAEGNQVRLATPATPAPAVGTTTTTTTVTTTTTTTTGGGPIPVVKG